MHADAGDDNSKPLVEAICEAIDVWHVEHPELTIKEILRALEVIRATVTEGVILANKVL